MSQSKSLSGFTNKTKEKMEDVLGKEEYAKPIAKSLGKNWIDSFKKFMSPKKIAKLIKKINIGFLGIESRNPAENEKNVNALKTNELDSER